MSANKPVYPGAGVKVVRSFTNQEGKGASFMPEWWNSPIRSPYYFLILGGILFFAAVVSTCTRKTWTRFQGCIDRAKEPSDFWWVVAIYYLGSVLFIGIFLYAS
jgi:hypothetical protein